MHAEVCPICHGKGTIPNNYGEWQPITTGTESSEKVCHGCGGKGWVEVSDSPVWNPWYPLILDMPGGGKVSVQYTMPGG